MSLYIDAWLSMFEQHRPLGTHYIVAQTNLRPCNRSKAQIDQFQAKTSKALRHALNCFTSMVNPGHVRRARNQPDQLRPSSLCTIEFLNPNVLQCQTVHANVILGNISKEFSTADIERFFRHSWNEKAGQLGKVHVQELNSEHTTFDYIFKEAKRNPELAIDCFGTVDLPNFFVPRNPAFSDLSQKR